MQYSSKEWKHDADPVIIYQTNLYSGTDDDIAGTEKFTGDIDMTEYTNVEIDFRFDANNSTDDLYLKLYKRNDDVWTGYELQWKSTLTVENSGTETIYHYTIPLEYGAGYYRFGMVRSGSTTTFDMDVRYTKQRTWNVIKEE